MINLNQEMVLTTRGLSKAFGRQFVLNDLNICVPKNAIVGFLGPNGAGKSTTIKLLLGLSRPTAGSGRIFGMDICKQSDEIRKRVGYLPQSPQFYKDMTAREILMFTAHFFFKGPQSAVKRRVDEMLELVGLQDKADRKVAGFSGGERQRLGIAQAQINYPDLLILDEPAAALDPMGRRDVLEIMERLRKYSTIFYSTHILEDVQRVSDQVVILNHGKLMAEGPIETLLSGKDGLVYRLMVEGSAEHVHKTLQALPWVSGIETVYQNGCVVWEVKVNDENAARHHLLRTVMAVEGANVLEFGRVRQNLEQYFIDIVKGGKTDGGKS